MWLIRFGPCRNLADIMQSTRAIVCRSAGASLQRTELEPFHVTGLAAGGRPRGAEVYVLEHTALARLAGSLRTGIMADRGAKDDRRGLAHYFAGGDGLRRLSADYSQVGQAERGIRALLAAIERQEAANHCFIGVPARVFDALWARAPEHPAGAAVRAAGSAGNASLAQLRELIAMHPEIEIPESVRQSFIGNAPVVRLVHYLIVLAARCSFPVLIEGETGTGKEVVARQIHGLQFGRDGKCVCVNCAGIPSELLESELFGHVRGAFTSATRDKVGLWQDAQDGTLFLDEIGDMAPSHQAKVLRAIEEGQFLPVGGVKPIASNARLLSATHRSLEAMVRDGRFREDLYHRLVVIRIRTPSLREHPEDIPALARHLWDGIRLNKSQRLPEEVTALLQQQVLPGNVRELRSLLSGIAMVSFGKPVTMRMARVVLRERGIFEKDG
jgi:transcriptional regulator of acetoin/glycerol metabolism